MLQFEILDEHGRPHILRGSRVLVRDVRTHNPVAVAAEVGRGMIEAAVANNSDFNETLHKLGLTETVLVTELTSASLPKIKI